MEPTPYKIDTIIEQFDLILQKSYALFRRDIQYPDSLLQLKTEIAQQIKIRSNVANKRNNRLMRFLFNEATKKAPVLANTNRVGRGTHGINPNDIESDYEYCIDDDPSSVPGNYLEYLEKLEKHWKAEQVTYKKYGIDYYKNQLGETKGEERNIKALEILRNWSVIFYDLNIENINGKFGRSIFDNKIEIFNKSVIDSITENENEKRKSEIEKLREIENEFDKLENEAKEIFAQTPPAIRELSKAILLDNEKFKLIDYYDNTLKYHYRETVEILNHAIKNDSWSKDFKNIEITPEFIYQQNKTVYQVSNKRYFSFHIMLGYILLELSAYIRGIKNSVEIPQTEQMQTQTLSTKTLSIAEIALLYIYENKTIKGVSHALTIAKDEFKMKVSETTGKQLYDEFNKYKKEVNRININDSEKSGKNMIKRIENALSAVKSKTGKEMAINELNIIKNKIEKL